VALDAAVSENVVRPYRGADLTLLLALRWTGPAPW
jgi:hypothetical protein